MKLIDLENITLPDKSIEEFRRFDLSDIFSKNYDLDYNTLYTDDIKMDLKDFIVIYNLNSIITYEKIDGLSIYKSKEFKYSKNLLYNLNNRLNQEFFVIDIEKELDKPILLINLFSGENKYFDSNIKVHIKNRVTIDILDVFISKDLKDSYINTSRNLLVENHSNLNYTKHQNLALTNSITTNYELELKSKTNLNFVLFDYGADNSLNQINSELNFKNSILNIDGIIKIKDAQKSGNIGKIIHKEESTYSDINFKHIVDNKAYALFDIEAVVEKSAKYSKVFQNSQSILLEKYARVHAIPRLKIFIDELEARHGATTGSIDEDELFYLKSRGISEKKAKKIILEAIEKKVIDKIKNQSIKDWVQL